MSEHGEATRKGCLRRGCLGCLVIVGAGIGLVVIMAVITLVRGVPDGEPDVPHRLRDFLTLLGLAALASGASWCV